MKLEKKHYVIIGVVIVAIAVWYFFLRKKPTESGYAGVRNRKIGVSFGGGALGSAAKSCQCLGSCPEYAKTAQCCNGNPNNNSCSPQRDPKTGTVIAGT
jgi:hypothetical protein